MTALGDRAPSGPVWYVGYGSNLSAARFGRYLARCRDTTAPQRWKAVEVPHRLLFARQSSTWGGGVAFLDPAATPGTRTLGRAWLVTLDQFADVLAQECGLPVGSVEAPPLDGGLVVAHPGHWYGCVVPLGALDEWPMVTFTDERAADLVPSRPGAAYRAVVAEGLAETHGLSPAEADAYIAERHPVATLILHVKVRQVIRALEDDGWRLDRQAGSHRQYRHPIKPGTVTVPGHLGDDLAPGTLGSIRRQAGLRRT